jgi:hypothetical protein
MKSPREIVLKYYPKAQAVNVGCKSGKYYHIMSEKEYLGKGKSSKNAWIAAYHNLDN